MNELGIIILFGIYFSIGSIRVIYNYLNFDRWIEFEQDAEACSRMNDLIFNSDISKQNPEVIKGYIQCSLQRKFTKRDFALWACFVLLTGPLNLLSLPNRW